MIRSMAWASVAVPTVERALAPIRSWSTVIVAVRFSSESTSGRGGVAMNPWTNAEYVSLMSRCDSAAIVPNTSELLPEPDTPVKTVSRRFGISTVTSLRLFTRAPRTRMRSWVSAACVNSRVLEQPEDVAVGVGDGGHQAAAAHVVRRLVDGGARGGHLGQLRLNVRHVPVGHRRGHALRSTAGDQPDVLTLGLEADVVGPVGLRLYAEQGGVHRLGRRQVGHGMQHGLDS